MGGACDEDGNDEWGDIEEESLNEIPISYIQVFEIKLKKSYDDDLDRAVTIGWV